MSLRILMKVIQTTIIMAIPIKSIAQHLDIGKIADGEPFKISGSISANSVYNHSYPFASTTPFTYFMQGQVNIDVFSFSVPLQYQYTDQGGQGDYSLPINYNTFSMHPKFGWANTHIGWISTSFSPYSLSGHQYIGTSAELKPSKNWQTNIMVGELIQNKKNDGQPKTIPAYSRWGYGAQLIHKPDEAPYEWQALVFYAHDIGSTLDTTVWSKKIYPQSNLVIGLATKVKLFDALNLNIDITTSSLTENQNSETEDNISLSPSTWFLPQRSSTQNFSAIKTSLSYNIIPSLLMGFGIDRVSPQYRTLGAYYFNQNYVYLYTHNQITLLDKKIKASSKIGYQKNNLDLSQAKTTDKITGSIQSSYTPNKEWNFALSYNNLQTIQNQLTSAVDRLALEQNKDAQKDTINYYNYRQSFNINCQYSFPENDLYTQNIQLSLDINDAVNLENNILRIGGNTITQNYSLQHSLTLKSIETSLSSSIIYTQNHQSLNNSRQWGANSSVSKGWFDNTLQSSIMFSYNQSYSLQNSLNNYTSSGQLAYTLFEKHNLSLNLQNTISVISQEQFPNSQINMTFGYNYSF